MKRLIALLGLLIIGTAMSQPQVLASHYNYVTKWYPAGIYDGVYYQAGYYRVPYGAIYHYQPLQITTFVPYLAYQPVAFSTYQPTPGVYPNIQPNPLAQVPQAVMPNAAPSAGAKPQQQPDDCAKKTQALEARLAQLEALLKQSQPQSQAAPPADPKNELLQQGLAIISKRCANCHEKSVAKDKGDGFAMMAGNVMIDLTDKQFDKVRRLLLSGKMPKKGSLEQNEGPILMEFLELKQTLLSQKGGEK